LLNIFVVISKEKFGVIMVPYFKVAFD